MEHLWERTLAVVKPTENNRVLSASKSVDIEYILIIKYKY